MEQAPKAGQSRRIDAEAIRYTRGLSEVAGQPVVCSGRAHPAFLTPAQHGVEQRRRPRLPVDDMTRLRRFLILGSEGGSYYARNAS